MELPERGLSRVQDLRRKIIDLFAAELSADFKPTKAAKDPDYTLLLIKKSTVDCECRLCYLAFSYFIFLSVLASQVSGESSASIAQKAAADFLDELRRAIAAQRVHLKHRHARQNMAANL